MLEVELVSKGFEVSLSSSQQRGVDGLAGRVP